MDKKQLENAVKTLRLSVTDLERAVGDMPRSAEGEELLGSEPALEPQQCRGCGCCSGGCRCCLGNCSNCWCCRGSCNCCRENCRNCHENCRNCHENCRNCGGPCCRGGCRCCGGR
jgi:hypothetical protein